MASNPRPAPGPVPPGQGALAPDNWDINALPGAFDEEIGAIFCDMRDASGLTKPELARKLTTSIRTLDALEQGALLALPAWPETRRVILAYTGMLGLDGQPILSRIGRHYSDRGPRPRLAAPAMPEVSGAPRRAGHARAGLWVLAAVTVAGSAAGMLYAAQQPALVLSVTDGMPGPIARMMRTALQGDPVPASADPRSRKADRLPVRGEGDATRQ